MSRVLTVLGLLGSLLLAACGEGSDDPDTDVITAGDVAVLMETEPYSGDVGGIGLGVVLAVVDGCVGYEPPEGEPVLLVFPPGTTVEGAGASLTLTVEGNEYRIGDRYPGGTRDANGPYPLSSYGDLAATAPRSCRDLKAFSVSDD